MSQDTNLSSLVINKLTQKQYDENVHDSSELYVTKDTNSAYLGDLQIGNTISDERLHALKGYSDKGELLEDAEGLADVKEYAHSTFDRSKFTVTGTPTITDDGIVLSTSTNNYFYITDFNSALPNKFTLNFKVRTPATLPVSHTWIALWLRNSEDSNARIFCRIDNNSSNWYFGYKKSDNTYQIKKFTEILANTLYDITIDIDGSNITVKVNGEEFLSGDDLKIDTNVRQLCVGSGVNNDQYWENFDLKTVNYSIDGVPVFSGNKTGTDTIKPDNYTVVGTPTISADGILTTSTNNYVLTPSFNITNAEDFELVSPFFSFETQSSVFQQGLNWANNTNDTWFFVQRRNSSGNLEVGIASQNTNVYSSKVVTTDANTWYQVKFKYTYPNWFVYYRTKTTDWQQINSSAITDTSKVTIQGTRPIAYKIQTNESLQYGQADLNGMQMWANGNLVYQPCLKIPYTLSKTGSKVVDSVYRSRVNDMAEQFGYANYYTLNENKANNYTVVGSPTISADGIASGFSNSNYIVAPNNFLSADTWKIEYPISATQTNQAGIIAILADFCLQIVYTPTDKRINYALSSNGSSWDVGSSSFVASSLDNTKDSIFVIEYTGTQYKLGIYQNDVNVGGVTIDNTAKLYQSNNQLILGNNRSRNAAVNGSIDLNSFKIYVDGKLAYKAIQPPCFTLPQAEVYGLIQKNSTEIATNTAAIADKSKVTFRDWSVS
jgi:hypothetical protein